MLNKLKFDRIYIGLVAMVLAAAPALAIAQSEIYEGGWSDGATILWQCSKNAEGSVKFQLTLPDGKVYQGTLPCGTPV